MIVNKAIYEYVNTAINTFIKIAPNNKFEKKTFIYLFLGSFRLQFQIIEKNK